MFWRENGDQVKKLEAFDDEIHALAFCPFSKLLAAGSLNNVFIWKINPDDEDNLIEKRVFHQVAPRRVVYLAFSDDGSFFGIASRDKTVQVWKLHGEADPTLREVVTRHRHGPLGISLFTNDSEAWMASCGRSGVIEIADLRDQNSPTASTTVPAHSQAVDNVLISPNNKLVATSSADGVIHL